MRVRIKVYINIAVVFRGIVLVLKVEPLIR